MASAVECDYSVVINMQHRANTEIQTARHNTGAIDANVGINTQPLVNIISLRQEWGCVRILSQRLCTIRVIAKAVTIAYSRLIHLTSDLPLLFWCILAPVHRASTNIRFESDDL